MHARTHARTRARTHAHTRTVRITDTNAVFSNLTGYDKEQVVGSTMTLLLEGEDTDIDVVRRFMDDCDQVGRGRVVGR